MAVTACVIRPARAALATIALVLPVFALSAPARADLLIYIDKTDQRMNVSVDGETLYDWPISSGLRRYETPSGRYQPFRMERDHFSREWDWAPMPHSIFFTKKGHAIHGSSHRSAIGQPASHGCVRLKVEHARILFSLVRKQKMANTLVVLAGETPDHKKPAEVAARTPETEPDTTAPEPVAGAADRPIVELEPGQLQEYGPLPQDLRPGQPIPPRFAREFRNGAPVYYEYNGRLYAEPPPIMREEYAAPPPPPPPVRRRYYRERYYYRRF